MSKRVGRDRGRERSQETLSTATSIIAEVTKRARFDKSTLTTESTTTSKRQSPKALALDYILGKT
eukprot:14210614-Ditylum_brightwellii.AAC.1